MKTITSRMRPHPELARRIAEADLKLAQLDLEIAKIEDPAGDRLRERIEALKIECKALKRNFREVSEDCSHHDERLKKVEELVAHIEREEGNIDHETAFLKQSPPSSVILAAQAGSRAVRKVRRKVQRIVGGRHPLGWSVFVNHTHEDLVERHGLRERPEKPAERESAPRKSVSSLHKRTETIERKPPERK